MCLASVAAVGWLALAMQASGANSEEEELRRALAEAGASSVEFIRALEKHLEKYPKTERRGELERALVKSAMEVRDSRRTIRYGERVLGSGGDDVDILERVTRALLENEDPEAAGRALVYAQRMEKVVRGIKVDEAPEGRARARLREEIDLGLSRSMTFQARATGNLGKAADAVTLARQAFSVYPSAESAREAGRWLARLKRNDEAITHYADAFTISDPRVSDSARAQDRARLGELYRAAKGSEAGLGDLILASWDRNAARIAARMEESRKLDPNAGFDRPLEFSLTGVKGDRLAMKSLVGKVVVLDFWATWCAPCREQYPLYETVKETFSDRQDVAFLAIATDEDRSLVAPFLERQEWNKMAYFEDGLSALLKINSIPTTIVLNRRGEVSSRMNGFIRERFVDMLTERIRDALAE
jgi:thiol-disulfide isomerase/thioredoxin